MNFEEIEYPICRVENCIVRRWKSGMCSRHFRLKKDGRPLDTPYVNIRCAGKQCEIAGCDRPAKCKGICKQHYERKRRNSDTWNRVLPPRRRNVEKLVCGPLVRAEVAKELKEFAAYESTTIHGALNMVLDSWFRNRAYERSRKERVRADPWSQQKNYDPEEDI